MGRPDRYGRVPRPLFRIGQRHGGLSSGATREGRGRVPWFDRSGAEVHRFWKPTTASTCPSRLTARWGAVNQNRDGNRDIWRLDLEAGQRSG